MRDATAAALLCSTSSSFSVRRPPAGNGMRECVSFGRRRVCTAPSKQDGRGAACSPDFSSLATSFFTPWSFVTWAGGEISETMNQSDCVKVYFLFLVLGEV